TRYWRDWSSDVCSSDLRGGCGAEIEVWLRARGRALPAHALGQVVDELVGERRHAVLELRGSRVVDLAVLDGLIDLVVERLHDRVDDVLRIDALRLRDLGDGLPAAHVLDQLTGLHADGRRGGL